MAGTISFAGLSSDQDFNQIIDGLVQAREYSRIKPMENWKSSWEAKLDILSEVDSRLSSFYTTVRGMDTVDEFLARNASTTNAAVATATADSDATPGMYNLAVGPLWNYRRAVTVANGSGSDIENGLVRIDESQLDSDFWSNVAADHSDLRFYRGDQQLDFYVQNWDYGAQTADIWVRADQIAAGGEEISMYYGNADAADVSTASLTDLKPGWEENAGVRGGLWQFDGDAADASGNGNAGAMNGSAAYDAADASWIEQSTAPPDYGQSLALDGIDSFVQVDARYTVDSTNSSIDFAEDGGSELTAAIAEGTYTASELSAAIETALNTSGSGTYTVTYDAATQGYTVSAAGVTNLELLWGSGTHAANSAASLLGFSAADETGGVSYTSDKESDSTLDMPNGFTASVWVRLEAADKSTSSLVDRFNDSDATRQVFSLGLNAAGQATFDMVDDAAAAYNITGTADLADGGWHQVAVAVDNTSKEIKLYVDGAQSGATTSYTGEIQASGDPLGIGARISDGSASNLFTGSIDEVRLAGRVMDGTEIKADYDRMQTDFDCEPADSELAVGGQTTLAGLAAGETEIHAGASSSDAVVNASGSAQIFAYRYAGGGTVSVDVPDGATLAELVLSINSDPDNPGVNASVVNDGLGTATSYRLVLNGNDTGKANFIVFDDSATTLDGTAGTLDFTSDSFTETQTAQNAQFTVNNFAMERGANQISDAIDGVNLKLIGTGSATVSVGTDTAAVVEKAQQFLEAFNQVRDALKDASYYDPKTGKSSILLSNYALQIVKSRLDAIVSSSAPGFRASDEDYVTFSQLGFSTDATEGSETEGLLLLDTAKLTEAINANPEGVAKLFSAVFEGDSNDSQITVDNSLTTLSSTATAGIYQVEIELTEGDPNYGMGRFKLEGGSWGNWVPMTGSSGSYYLTGVEGPEDGLVLQVAKNSGDGNVTAEVRVKNGLVQELGREMEKLLSSDGPLETVSGNYNDIIDNIDGKIEREQKRLDQYEEMLKQQFARLDQYMARMTQMGNAFGSMVSSQSSK